MSLKQHWLGGRGGGQNDPLSVNRGSGIPETRENSEKSYNMIIILYNMILYCNLLYRKGQDFLDIQYSVLQYNDGQTIFSLKGTISKK